MSDPAFLSAFSKAVVEAMEEPPQQFSHDGAWESLTFPEGYEKPPKDVVEAKLEEILNAQKLEEEAEKTKVTALEARLSALETQIATM